MNMTGWGLTNVNGTVEIVTINTTVTADIEAVSALDGSTLYWLAPSTYLGNRVCFTFIM